MTQSGVVIDLAPAIPRLAHEPAADGFGGVLTGMPATGSRQITDAHAAAKVPVAFLECAAR
jgi:hypothetical protein